MSAEQVFSVANSLSVVCWLLLAVLPGTRWVTDVLTSRIVPGLFAVAYAVILLGVFPNATGSFSTLAGVATLFAHPWLLLAGWLHYLAFDLLTGTWEARDAVDRGVPRWALVPCLFLTLMFGPAGWLLYVLVRSRYRVRPAIAP